MKKIMFVIFLLAPITTFAADISDLSSGVASSYNMTQRKQLAEKLDEYLIDLDHRIPSLKPSEQKWVDDEREAIRSLNDKDSKLKRLVGLSESVEYQQDNIKHYIKSIREALSGVIKSNNLRNEIYYWSVVSYKLTEKDKIDGAIAILKRGNKIETQGLIYLGGDNVGGGFFYNSFGREIQEYFVIPYLGGSLQK